jgi:hypothetical protein
VLDLLGLSPDHVVERVEREPRTSVRDPQPTATLRYNETDPTRQSDGVDHVAVVAESAERYRLDCSGYYAGSLRTTRAGMVELGESLLGDRDPVPDWLLDVPAGGDVPWWVPDDYDGRPTVECRRCGEDTPAGDVVTLGHVRGAADLLCRDCWEAGPP